MGTSSHLLDLTDIDRSLTCCCCGFRFGWSAVIGIIPVIGDILDLLIALSIIRTCMEVELPKAIVTPPNTRTFADTIQVAQMYTNLAIDFGVGLVPVVGDLADAWFKCNTRNNLLLEKFLRERGATNPAPPPPPKQSTVRRWFGPGADASGSHPGHQVAATETPSQNTVGNNGNKSAAPVPPPRNTTGPKLSGRGVGTDGGKGVVDARERDLEAQIHHGGQDSIRYTRED